MRWQVPILGFGMLALAGCGSSGKRATTTVAHSDRAELVLAGLQPPSGCYVTVFLIENATKTQIAQVQNRLLRNNGVATVSFVSRGLALERFSRKSPSVAKGLRVNPFSDQFEVVPRSRIAVFSIIGDFATNGGPITNAKPSLQCAVTG